MLKKKSTSKRMILSIGLFTITLAIMVIALINAISFTTYPFAGFFFHPNRYVSFSERATWEGMKHGVKALDRIETINNTVITSGTQALKMIQRMEPGSVVDYTFSTKDENGKSVIKKLSIKLSKFTLKDFSVTFLLPLIIGLFFLGTGFAVFLLNPQKNNALIHYISSIFISIFYSTVLDSNTTYWFYRLFAMYPFFGAASVHLILTITAAKFLRRYPLTQYTPYFLASIIVLLQEYYLYSEQSVMLIYVVSPIFLVGCVVLNFAYLLVYYITTQDIASRRKTRFYLIALIFGTILPSVWSITFAVGSPVISLDWGIALSIFYPIFMGYAITREDLFSLESIIRSSLEYLSFTSLVVGMYILIAAVLSITIQKFLDTTPLINTTITIAVIIMLMPIRNRFQTFIDKTFYPERFDIINKLSDVSRDLSFVRDRKLLGVILGKKISSVIQVKEIGLIYPSKDNKSLFFSSPIRHFQLDLSKHVMRRIFPKPGVIEYFEDIVEAAPPKAKRREIFELRQVMPEYFLPIGNEHTRGVLVIGNKTKPDSSFINDDFQFLKSLYPHIQTALVNAELHEQKADREKLATIGEVASVIVHEIKNPLGIIRVSAGALKKRIEGDNKSSEIIGFIDEEVERMNETVSNFLNYARPKTPIKRFYNVEELDAYITNIKPDVEKDGHKLELNINNMIKGFTVDPDHLKQMLLNLIYNAKDAMTDGGVIGIDVSHDDEFIYLTVSNTGKPIEKDISQKLFDPFFTTKEHGTGLGLSVTKQLARSNGGDIKWDEVNGKTSFIINLSKEEYNEL
jgi:signal transduction histidine kinase